jgi:hypothetical protein
MQHRVWGVLDDRGREARNDSKKLHNPGADFAGLVSRHAFPSVLC